MLGVGSHHHGQMSDQAPMPRVGRGVGHIGLQESCNE